MANYYELSKPVSENDHLQGNKNAPIILVEYGDYQCPYCGQAYSIIKQLQEDFGNHLGFVFRNFPLSQIHEHALHAAEAAEIASDEGKFWEMHDSLYENQEYLNDSALVERAKNLGLNVDGFIEDLQNDAKEEVIKEDFMSGVESGVNGTPSLFINGEKYDGSWDYESFKQVLKSLL